MEDMDAALWGGLPSGIGERALSYLSVPVLCRFRSVCKRWNSLICDPEFGALCIRNAARDASFLVARSYIDKGDSERGQNHGWVFLDVNARRWYTIRRVIDQELFDQCDVEEHSCCVAMDGGLVCQVLPGMANHENASVFVSNPIAQTASRLLPTLKCSLQTSFAVVDMVVDAGAGCYTIFVLPNDGKLASEENPFMVMYESRTDAWRGSSLPVVTEVCVNVEHSVVFFNSLLYVLASCADPGDPRFRGYGLSWLWSYSYVEDTWKDTGVMINLDALCDRSLLVSDSRLFLASWLKDKRGWSYQVSEIDLQERTISTVFRVAGAAMAEQFGVGRRHVRHMLLHAFGLGKSIILLCQESGIAKVYDLGTCTWDALPENRALAQTQELGQLVCFGKPMTLVMPGASESWKKAVPELADSLASV